MSQPSGDPAHANRFAAEGLASGDPTGWFERLYAAAQNAAAEVPWARLAPREQLVEWADAHAVHGDGRPALVVGAGLGDDAEFVAGLGFDTVAFDVAPSAIAAARGRFPDSAVRYRVADLLALPEELAGAFAFVFESLTVQSLPDDVRPQAIANVARTVASGGTLLVIASARDGEDGPIAGPPWPLLRTEVDAFAVEGLEAVEIERLPVGRDSRWRAEFRRR